MENNFLLLIITFISCILLRSVYELLKDAKIINQENKLIFAIILTVMCVLWISWFGLCPADPSRIEIPAYVRWIGLAEVTIGTIMAVGSIIQLRGVENINHLVTTGLFSKIRHPMYMGFILWMLGWSIYHGAVISLGIGIIGSALVLWWRHLEESRLDIQFGSHYQQYRSRTWF